MLYCELSISKINNLLDKYMKNAGDFFSAVGNRSSNQNTANIETTNLRGATDSSTLQAPNLRGSTDPTNIPTSGNSFSTLPSDSININDGGSSIINFLNQTGRGNFIDIGKRSFILEIISSWYLLVAIPAMTVTYNVFKTLQDKGILQALYNNVDTGLKMLIEVSATCPQFIDNIERLFQCLSTGR